MSKESARLAALASVLLLAFSACSSSGGHTGAFAPPNPSQGARKQHVTLRIKIPKQSEASRKHRKHYVSPATTQMVVDVQTGCPGSCVNYGDFPVTVPLTPTSSGCSSTLASTICQLQLSLAPGDYTATLAAEDANAQPLSTSQSAFSIVAGAANTLPITLSGIPHAILATGLGHYAFLAQALDADGNTIVGPGSPSFAIARTSGKIAVAQPLATSPNVFYVTPSAEGASAIAVTASYDIGATDGCAQSGATCSASFNITATLQSVNLFVSASVSRTITQYAPPYTGTAISTAALQGPFGIAINAEGTLFAADQGSIKEFNAPYTTQSGAVPNGVSAPTELAFDSNDNLFVLMAGNGNVVEYAPPYTGNPTVLITGVSLPSDIALDASNDLYFTSDGNGGVTSGIVSEYAPPYSAIAAQLGGFFRPHPVAFDASGNTYIADTANDTVTRTAAFPSSPMTLINDGSSPNAMAFDLSSNLYVADQTTNAVLGYAPPYTGASTTIQPGLQSPKGLAFLKIYATTIAP
jgi:hypothetical protein